MNHVKVDRMITVKYTDFSLIVELAHRLEKYLKDNGVKLSQTSRLATDFLKTREVLDLHKNEAIPEGYDIHEALNSLANVFCLAKVIIGSIGTEFELEVLKQLPHLKKGVPGPLTSEVRSRDRDIIFELLCGRVCTNFTEDVRFKEPDVICNFQSKKWGLACKTAYGSVESISRRIRRGFSQINRANIDFGFVVVQLTNIFPHDKMYLYDITTNTISCYWSKENLISLITSLLKKTVDLIEKSLAKYYRGTSSKIPNKVRGILFVVHTVAYYRNNRVVIGRTQFSRPPLISHNAEFLFAEKFNNFVQKL